MRKRIIELTNFIELVENGTISIVSVENKVKLCADIEETDQIFPEKFMESIRYLNKAKLFSNGIDFYYEFIGSKILRIDCAMKNSCLDEHFYVDCVVKDGVSMKDVNEKLRETIFDRMVKKLAM